MTSVEQNHRLRPDRACRLLAAGAAKAAKQTTKRVWQVEVNLTVAGTVSFRFSNDLGWVLFTWTEEGGFGFPGLPGSLMIEDMDMERSGVDRRLLETLARVLVNASSREQLRFLAPTATKVGEDALGSDDALSREMNSRLAHEWFSVDEARWYDYRVRKTEAGRNDLTVTYFDGEREVVLWIGPAMATPMTARGKRRHEPVFVRGRVGLVVLRDSRDDGQRAAPAHQVEGPAALAVARTVPEKTQHLDVDRHAEKGLRDQSGHLDRRFTASVYRLPASTRWRQFMAEGHVSQFGGFGFLDSPHTVLLDFSDRACAHMSALTGDKVPLFNFVDVDRHERATSVQALVEADEMVSTGGEDTLRRGLDEVVAVAGARDAITLRKTCALKLLGHDIEPICVECEEAHGVKIGRFHPEETFLGPHSSAGMLLSSFLSPAAELERSPDPTVSLVWFERRSEREELTAYLAAMGVGVTGSLFPGIDLEEIASYKTGWVQVFPQSDTFERDLSAVMDGIGLESVTPPGPYGVGGTVQWLQAVAASVGGEEAWREWMTRNRPSFDQLADGWAERCSDLGFAFVVDPRQLTRIWDPRRNWGLSYLRVLQELGFRVLAFVFRDSEVDAQTQLSEIRDELAAAGHRDDELEISLFSDEAELMTLLSADTHAAVFTDYTADTRVEAVGKAWFSFADFERGIEGATRTFERLLRRAQTPYFSRQRALR